MANLKGQGSHKDVSLIVEVMHGNDKGKFLTVQIDQSLKNPESVRSGKSTADTNPYLVSKEVEHPNGGKYVSHMAFYQNSQIDKILAAAKEAKLPDGKSIYGLKATVFPQVGEDKKPNFNALVIDTKKPMEATANPRFGKTTLEKQAAVMSAAKDHAKAEKAAMSKKIETEAEQQKALMENPEIVAEQPEA